MANATDSGRMPISKSIYMDVCALSRPFDEQDYVRIRIETEAVNLILLKVIEGSLRLLVSPVHMIEIEAIPDGNGAMRIADAFEGHRSTG